MTTKSNETRESSPPCKPHYIIEAVWRQLQPAASVLVISLVVMVVMVGLVSNYGEGNLVRCGLRTVSTTHVPVSYSWLQSLKVQHV